MVEDLLAISKILLEQIGRLDFTYEEKEYIIGVVRKVIFVVLIELNMDSAKKRQK